MAAESLLDGSYWSISTTKRERSNFKAKKQIVTETTIPKRKKYSKPSKPLTEEQKKATKEKRDLARSLVRENIENEHKRNEEKK